PEITARVPARGVRIWDPGERSRAGIRKEMVRSRSQARRGYLGVQDFSATTDLYQIVANVYAMRFVPVDFKSLLMLAGATLLPFLPVALLEMPLDALVTRLKELLL